MFHYSSYVCIFSSTARPRICSESFKEPSVAHEIVWIKTEVVVLADQAFVFGTVGSRSHGEAFRLRAVPHGKFM